MVDAMKCKHVGTVSMSLPRLILKLLENLRT